MTGAEILDYLNWPLVILFIGAAYNSWARNRPRSEVVLYVGFALLVTFIIPIQRLGFIAMLTAAYLVYRENREKSRR
jgi:hypothetical protein